jgi:hypothetical protein
MIIWEFEGVAGMGLFSFFFGRLKFL